MIYVMHLNLRQKNFICQENFILHGNRFKIKQCQPNVRIYFKKAVKDSMDRRPRNGMIIAVADEITFGHEILYGTHSSPVLSRAS